MITQVIFKIDKKIKEKAQKKAKEQGTTFSEVLKMSTYAYANGALKPMLVSTITDTEQRDIEARYGKKPSHKSVASLSFKI